MVIFLDTGFILAIRNQDDINHSKAIKIMKDLLHSTITWLDFAEDDRRKMMNEKNS